MAFGGLLGRVRSRGGCGAGERGGHGKCGARFLRADLLHAGVSQRRAALSPPVVTHHVREKEIYEENNTREVNDRGPFGTKTYRK